MHPICPVDVRDASRTHGELFSKVPKLGPALTSSVPTPRESHGPPLDLDVETDQNLNSKYVLSGAQRSLIKTGSASDRSTRNNGVLQKRDYLPNRIQDLLEDVALLHDTVYLSSENWESGKVERKQTQSAWTDLHRQFQSANEETELENLTPEEREIDQYESPFEDLSDLWKELLSVDRRGQQVRDDVFFYGRSVASREAQFGYEIGSLLRILRPEQDEDIPGADLIWGFILAFIAQSRDSMDREQEILEELTTVMEDNHDIRRNDADRAADQEDLSEFADPAEKVTASAIEEAGFEPHPILVREVLHHQPALENETHHKNAVKELLSKITDTVPLRQIDQLFADVTQDLSTLKSRSTPGIESAELVLKGHMNQDESDDSDETDSEDTIEEPESGDDRPGNLIPEATTKTSTSIGKTIDVDDGVVTTILNRLSDNQKGDLWTTRPIFEDRNNGWRPTPYGKLLAHVYDRRQGDPELLYWFALGPEEVSLYERKLIMDVFNADDSVSLTPSD